MFPLTNKPNRTNRSTHTMTTRTMSFAAVTGGNKGPSGDQTEPRGCPGEPWAPGAGNFRQKSCQPPGTSVPKTALGINKMHTIHTFWCPYGFLTPTPGNFSGKKLPALAHTGSRGAPAGVRLAPAKAPTAPQKNTRTPQAPLISRKPQLAPAIAPSGRKELPRTPTDTPRK